MKKNISQIAAAIALLCVVAAPRVSALDIDFSGEFESDAWQGYEEFEVQADSTVTVFTSSWMDHVSGLGFDPVVQIWDGVTQELIIEQNNNGSYGTASSNGVDYGYGEWDVHFDQFLAAGSYVITIVQYHNAAAGQYLYEGWTHERDHEFTQDYGPEEFFNGADGTTRTGEWALHVTNIETGTSQTPIPEPATLTLLGLGIAGLVYRGKRA